MQRIILLVFGLLFINVLQAQRFEGSLVVGGNFAQIDGDDLAGYNKAGLHVGGRVAAVLDSKWQVSMDLLFSQRGSSRGPREIAVAYDKIAFNYVEVPVMINLMDWKFQVGAGFSYSRLFSYEVIDGLGDDITDVRDFRSNNIAFIADATYWSNDNFGLGLRWNIGFINLEPNRNNAGLIEKWLSARAIYRFNKIDFE